MCRQVSLSDGRLRICGPTQCAEVPKSDRALLAPCEHFRSTAVPRTGAPLSRVCMSVMCRYVLCEYGVQVRVCEHDLKYKPEFTRVSCVHLCVLNAVKTS